MSTTHFASSQRQVGDMSILLPSGCKGWFESARDGSIFPVADKYAIVYETSQSCLRRDGVTTLLDSAARPLSFTRVTSDTQNSLITTYTGGSSSPYCTHGVYRYNANTLTNQATRSWTTGFPQSFRCGPSQRVGLFVDGANATLCTLYADVSGSQGYYLHATTWAITGNLSITGIMQATGSMLIGRQNAADVNARSTMIAGLFMFAAASGVSFADLGLNTDLGKTKLLVDPHSELSRINSGLDYRRSFDLCNSAGQRIIVDSVIGNGSGYKLKCIHSGQELTYQQDASPTSTAEAREAYSPLSHFYEHRTSAVADPHTRKVGDVVFSGSHYGSGQNVLENAIDRRDPLTGYRIAPSILLPPILYREDATTGAAISGGLYYQNVSPTIPSENHQDIVLAYNAATDRLVAKVGHHSDRTGSGVPAAGQITSDTSGFWTFRDNALPKPSIVNFGAETVLNRTNSYGVLTANGSDVLAAVRVSDTTNGRIRIVKVASDDTNSSRIVTAVAGNAIDAGYPVDMATLADGTVLACYAVRANGAQGFIGPALIAIDPANFDSLTTGWYAVRTGVNIAPQMPNLPWHYPQLYTIPCPARDALDLYTLNGTLPNASAWAYDLQPPPACLFLHTDGGVQFVGVLTGEHDDPDRNNGAFSPPETSGNNREVGLKLHVHAWDSAAKILRYLRSIDLFTAKRRAAASMAGASTIVGNKDYNWGLSQALVNRGARAIIGVPRSDAQNYTNDAVGWALAGLGKSIGCIDVQDWHLPTYTVDGYGPIVEAAEYGAATLLARPLDGTTIELQLTRSGADGSIATDSQSSCFTRYRNISFQLLPKTDRGITFANV